MPPKSEVTKITDPFVPIQKLPLFTTSQLQASRYAIVLDPDGANLEAGIVSRDYNLVENSFVVEAAERVLEQAGVQATISRQLWDGRHFIRKYTIDDERFIIDANPAVGDHIAASLDVKNSYDGTTKFGLAFNLTRLVCLNGMVVQQRLGGFNFKHNATNEEEFDKEVETAVRHLMGMAPNLALLAPKFQRLTQIRSGREDFIHAIDKLKVSDQVAMDVLRAQEQDNAWGLLNAFTATYTGMESLPAETANRNAVEYFMAMVD